MHQTACKHAFARVTILGHDLATRQLRENYAAEKAERAAAPPVPVPVGVVSVAQTKPAPPTKPDPLKAVLTDVPVEQRLEKRFADYL